MFGEGGDLRQEIPGVVDALYGLGREDCGELALAWQMMCCDPRRPESFNAVVPQLAWSLRHRSVITNAAEETLLRARLHLWWEAAAGKWGDHKDSIFAITARLADKEEIHDRHRTQQEADEQPEMTEPDPAAPTVVVMPKDRAEEKACRRRGRICATNRCRSSSAATPPRCASACRTNIRTRGARWRC